MPQLAVYQHRSPTERAAKIGYRTFDHGAVPDLCNATHSFMAGRIHLLPTLRDGARNGDHPGRRANEVSIVWLHPLAKSRCRSSCCGVER